MATSGSRRTAELDDSFAPSAIASWRATAARLLSSDRHQTAVVSDVGRHRSHLREPGPEPRPAGLPGRRRERLGRRCRGSSVPCRERTPRRKTAHPGPSPAVEWMLSRTSAAPLREKSCKALDSVAARPTAKLSPKLSRVQMGCTRSITYSGRKPRTATHRLPRMRVGIEGASARVPNGYISTRASAPSLSSSIANRPWLLAIHRPSAPTMSRRRWIAPRRSPVRARVRAAPQRGRLWRRPAAGITLRLQPPTARPRPAQADLAVSRSASPRLQLGAASRARCRGGWQRPSRLQQTR